jgi:ferredoxin
MRVTVDLTKCQGYANCVVEAPDVFDVGDENGKAVVLVERVPESLHDEARRAAASCPVFAISVEG